MGMMYKAIMLATVSSVGHSMNDSGVAPFYEGNRIRCGGPHMTNMYRDLRNVVRKQNGGNLPGPSGDPHYFDEIKSWGLINGDEHKRISILLSQIKDGTVLKLINVDQNGEPFKNTNKKDLQNGLKVISCLTPLGWNKNYDRFDPKQHIRVIYEDLVVRQPVRLNVSKEKIESHYYNWALSE